MNKKILIKSIATATIIVAVIAGLCWCGSHNLTIVPIAFLCLLGFAFLVAFIYSFINEVLQ